MNFMNSLKSRLNVTFSPTKVKLKLTLANILLIVILTLLMVIAALPGYLGGGKWAWQTPPKVAYLKPVRDLKSTGITVLGWKTLEQEKIKIGENEWSIQLIEQPNQSEVHLLLMPQSYNISQPEVEWTDLKYIEHLEEDSEQVLTFKAQVPNAQMVQARFFRGWKRNTYAVVQWYAWPGGGSFRPLDWFIGDQLARLHRSRLPWVAVAIKIPISALSDLKSVQPLATSLAQTVQTTLEHEVFSRVYTKPANAQDHAEPGKKGEN
jgi:cyanoexosortase B-associated protein